MAARKGRPGGTQAGPPGINDCAPVPNLKHKMSKKIAQLTKVIYLLNSRNDDHQHEVKHLTAKYEDEIDKILRDASAKITMFKSKLEASQDSRRTAEALQLCARQHEQYRDDAMEEFERYKKAMAEKQAVEQENYFAHMDGATRELARAKEDFAVKVARFDEATSSTEAQMRALKAKHQQEVKDLVTSANKKYNEMLAERMEAEEKLKQQLRGELSKGLDDALKDAQYDKRQLEKELRAEMNAAATRQHEEMETLRRQSKTSEDALRIKITSLEEDAARHVNRIAELEEELKASMLNHGDLSLQLERSLEEKSHLVEELSEKVNSLTREVATASARCADLESKLRMEENRLAEKERTSAADMEDLARQVAERNRENKTLEGRVRDLEQTNGQLSRDLALLRDAASSQQSDLSTSLSRAQQELENAREQHGRELAATIEKMAREAEASTEALRNEMEKQLVAVRAESEMGASEWQGKLRELERQLQTVTSSYEERLQVATSARESAEKDAALKAARVQELEARVQELEAQLASSASAAASSAQDIQSRLVSLEGELAGTRGKLEETQDSNATMTAELEQSKAAIGQLEEQISTLRVASEALERKLEEDAASARRALNDAVQQARDQVEAELGSSSETQLRALAERLDREHQIAMLKLREQLSRDKDTLEAQLREKIRRLEAQTKTLGDSLKKLEDASRTAQEQLEQDGSAQLTQAREAHAEQLRILEAQMKTEMDDLEARHAQTLADMETRHADELLALREELTTSMGDAADKKLQDLEAKFVADREALALTHEATLNEKQEAHRTEIAAMRKAHEGALLDAKAKSSMALARTEKENAELTSSLTDAKAEVIRLQSTKAVLEDSLNKLHQELGNKVEEILQIRRESTQQLAKQSQDLREAAETEKRSIKDAHALVIRRLNEEFQHAHELMEEKNAILQRKIEALEYQYIHREPRPEDTEQIRRLEHALGERTAQLQKSLDDMKYFKLELVNRDQNFTRTFSAGGGQRMNVGGPPGAGPPPRQLSRQKSQGSTTRLPPLNATTNPGGRPRQ